MNSKETNAIFLLESAAKSDIFDMALANKIGFIYNASEEAKSKIDNIVEQVLSDKERKMDKTEYFFWLSVQYYLGDVNSSTNRILAHIKSTDIKTDDDYKVVTSLLNRILVNVHRHKLSFKNNKDRLNWLWDLYWAHHKRVTYIKEQIKFKAPPRHSKKRKRVLIITNVFDNEYQSATKAVINLAYALKNIFKYDVYIINDVSWCYPKIEGTLFGEYNCKNENLNKLTKVKFGIEEFSYYQPQSFFIGKSEYNELLQSIYEYDPNFVILFGSGSVLADLCIDYFNIMAINFIDMFSIIDKRAFHLCYWSKMLPDFSLRLAIFTISIWINKQLRRYFKIKKISLPPKGFQDFAVDIGLADKKMLLPFASINYPLLNEKAQNLDKRKLNLSKDDFIIAITGLRLDLEINNTFLTWLDSLLSSNPSFKIMFIGKYSRYEDDIKKFSSLAKQSKNLGITDDLVNTYKMCDVFLNPDRWGGGFSAFYAMSVGLPVLSIKNYGDVNGHTGYNLAYNTWDDIKHELIKLHKSPKYYNKISKKFRNRIRIRRSFIRVLKNTLKKIERTHKNSECKPDLFSDL